MLLAQPTKTLALRKPESVFGSENKISIRVMESDNELNNPELPAWERESAQSPRVEEPDNKLSRSAIIAAAAIAFLLFIVAPLGVFSCGVNRLTNQQNSFPVDRSMQEEIQRMEKELNSQPPPVQPAR
jgi:hypothetical protein